MQLEQVQVVYAVAPIPSRHIPAGGLVRAVFVFLGMRASDELVVGDGPLTLNLVFNGSEPGMVRARGWWGV